MNAFPPRSASGLLTPGEKLGKFTIIEKIAAGSSADVWKGSDDLLGRQVAIKHLVIDESGEQGTDLRDRFRAEARLLKSLPSDNKYLVQVIEFFDEPRGLFIVTEFIDGWSLEQVLGGLPGPVDLLKTLVIIRSAARALETIHEAGIVHRDLKPSNILLPRDGGVKLCDFGLATLMAEQDIQTAGSARYMAPELFAEGPVDGRADIYSLGMIGYEVAVGRPAFNEAFKMVLRDQRNQALRWMKWHTNRRAIAPPLARLNPDVPATLAELIERMMAKDPSTRIASAGELIDVIFRHFTSAGQDHCDESLDQAPTIEAVPVVDTTAPTAPLAKKSRMPWIVAAALVITLTLMAGWGGWRVIRENRGVREKQRRGIEQFEKNRSFFRAGQYTKACTGFRRIQEHWSEDPELSRVSKAYVLLCGAHLDLEASRFGAALEGVDQADALDAIRDRDQIYALRETIAAEQAFDRIVASIDQAIDAGNTDLAQRDIREQRRRLLRPDQQARIDELGAKVQGRLAQQLEAEVAAEAGRLAEAGGLLEAIGTLREGLDRQESSRLRSQLKEYRTTLQISRAVAKADKAERQGELTTAASFVAEALKLRREDQLAGRLRSLQGRAAFEEGQRFEAKGQTDRAKAAYVRALGFGNSDAGAALDTLKIVDQINAIMRAGKQAVVRRDYEAAIEHFQKAVELGAGVTANQHLAGTRVKLELLRGRRTLEAGDLETARAAFEGAARIDSVNQVARRGLADVERLETYSDRRDHGDAEREKSNFGAAKRWYYKAQKDLEPQDLRYRNEIKGRIDDTEYEHLIAQAMSYMEAGQWTIARSKLISAERIQNSGKVRRLIQEVDRQISKKEQDEF